ncbi:MAG: RsmB/NOP family class I SAM-dependent RNA methyltransferase [Crenarchaeota archaeon]|nr:RsmB/NOP family class I SAM-dependent RNA methyltransferase [Thermoproteota archaeon]
MTASRPAEKLEKLLRTIESELQEVHARLWRTHGRDAERLARRVGGWLHPHHAARYIELLGLQEALKHFKTDHTKIMTTIRVNTLKADVEEVKESLEAKNFKVERHPYIGYGLVIKHAPISPGATREYMRGLYTIQGPASMLAVPAMEPEKLPGEPRIADQCAGAGVKTTQISQHRPDSAIAAIDINRRKLRALRNNAQRLAASNIAAYHMDGRQLDSLGAFDAVLLDAPCSGEGLTPFPKGQWPRSFDDIRGRVRLQAELLAAAYRALKPGGTLVYATCSLSVEENEYLLTRILQAFEGLEPQRNPLQHGLPGITSYAGIQLDPRLRDACRRFYPHIHHTEGFTICRLAKKG